MATVMLGLAPLEQLRVVEAEGARPYLLGMFATIVGLVVVWFLRRKPLIAVVVLLAWQGAVFWPLSARTSSLGLAFHGEYVMHHFTGLVAAATCIAVASSWVRQPDLGRARLVPAALVIAGALSLLAAHVLEQPSIGERGWPWLERGGAAALLLAWGLALATMGRHHSPGRLRIVAAVLLVPFLVRVAYAWPEGLAGASVVDEGRTPLMIAMFIAAMTTFALFRPNLAPSIRTLVLAFSGLAALLMYYFYRHGFGELEAGLGGLAQSMFAFSLPYPTYLPAWKVWGVMLGLFAMFGSAYAGLVSSTQRARGLALALLVVTGLGLSTPPLVLMTAAGALLWIDSLLDTPVITPAAAPTMPMTDIIQDAAAQLDAPGLVVIDDGNESLLAMRGDVNDTTVDLRARRSRRGEWELTLQVGVLGRSRPMLRLIPELGDAGHRPAHLLGRTHFAQGQVRNLELLDDSLFDALMPFRQAHVEFWDAGTRVRLGAALGKLDGQTLATLIRELTSMD